MGQGKNLVGEAHGIHAVFIFSILVNTVMGLNIFVSGLESRQLRDFGQKVVIKNTGTGLNEFDVPASWLAGHHILYLGMSDAIDFGDPEWLISPFFGLPSLLGKRTTLDL